MSETITDTEALAALEASIEAAALAAERLGNPRIVSSIGHLRGLIRRETGVALQSDPPVSSFDDEALATSVESNGEKPILRWREWMRDGMGITGGTDRQKAQKLAAKDENKQIASAVAEQLASEGRVQLSMEILQAAALRALTFAVRDFDPDGSESFEEFARRNIRLCVQSLPLLYTLENRSLSDIAVEAIHLGGSAYHSQKFHIDERRATDTSDRERHFIEWTGEIGIPGTTYHECILAATVHFMPAAVDHATRKCPNLTEGDRTSLLLSVSGNLNHLLLTFDPLEGANFYRLMTAKLVIPKRFSGEKKITPVPRSMPHAPSVPPAQKIPPSVPPVFQSIPKPQIPVAAPPVIRPRTASQMRRKEKNRKKKERKEETVTTPELPADSPAVDADAEVRLKLRETRIIDYVRRQVDGGDAVVRIADAVRVLRTANEEPALEVARRHLIRKCDVTKPDLSRLRTLVSALLEEAVSAFDPPDENENHFTSFLAERINRNIRERYVGS